MDEMPVWTRRQFTALSGAVGAAALTSPAWAEEASQVV